PEFRIAPSVSRLPSPISHLPVLRDKPHNISVSNALAGGAGAGILTLRRRRAPLSDTRSSEYGGGGADCGPAVVVSVSRQPAPGCRAVEGGGGLLCSASRAVTRGLVCKPR